MLRRSLCCLVAASLLAPLIGAPLGATRIRAVTLEESIDLSSAIVTGKVVAKRAARERDGGLLTVVTVCVEESLKGPYLRGDRIEVSAWGGEMGAARQVALGEAIYRRGERVLLQLEPIDGRLHTIGLAVGKWNLVRGADGDVMVRSLAGLEADGGAALTEGPLALDDFRALTRARLGGSR